MQIGAGYDIPLSTDANKTQFVLSPLFLSNLILVKIHVQQKHGTIRL
jgi:hypothetical protein